MFWELATYFLTAIIVFILLSKSRREKIVEKGRGICDFAIDQFMAKDEKKQKIVELLNTRGEMSNEEIREQFGIARRTVTRYMNELKEEEKVTQVGDRGRGVTYKISGYK